MPCATAVSIAAIVVAALRPQAGAELLEAVAPSAAPTIAIAASATIRRRAIDRFRFTVD
jgi:hypothetical protein